MKPGFKTTEFWLSLAAVLVGGLLASGLVTDDTSIIGQALAFASSALAAMGYSVSRAWTKVGEANAVAVSSLADSERPEGE